LRAWAWTAVMATASTMSSALQPRDKSFAAYQSLQDRPNGTRSGEPFRKFVSDVPGLKIGEDKHIGATCDHRTGSFD